MIDVRMVIAFLSTLAALALLLWPPSQFSTDMAHAAALCVFALGLFAAGIFPEHVTAVLFFLIAMLCAVAPASIVFSGFHSTAFWLVFGGVIISVAVSETGLGARLAHFIAVRLTTSYLRIVIGVSSVGVLSAFLIPTGMGRVVILSPLIMALADRFGFVVGTRGRTGILLAFCFCAIFPGFTILPANVPNVILMGGIEAQYGIYLSYAEYTLLHFPVLGLMKCVIVVGLVWLIYREPPQLPDYNSEEAGLAKSPPLRASELRLAGILMGALVLWILDFLHHISPGWIALGAAFLCLIPRYGVLAPNAFATQINFTPLFTTAGILGIASVVAHSGIGDLMGQAMLDAADLSHGEQGKTLIALVASSIGVGLAGTVVSIPAIMTPLVGGVSEATGMPLDVLLMSLALAYSTVFLPYQLPPLLVGAQVTGLGLAVTSRFCLLLAAATLIVLLPLDYLWWSFLGYLG